ncbi:MAG: hypothetical protein HYX82_00125 [Chloroflexi bacterium]|nr:hypothetical protein [Chloroflexota bacterium]
MAPKISQVKINKMMSMLLGGYTETWIAHKLGIDQSTVAKYKSKLKVQLTEHIAGKSGKGQDAPVDIDALFSLSADLLKNRLTVEEARVGLQMELLLHKCGVPPEDYPDLIQACGKMKDEGFMGAAIELGKLEKVSGMTYEQVLADAAATHQQLQKDQLALENVTEGLKAGKTELAQINKQKQSASDDLATYMHKVGVDMHRLKLTEGLALALKSADIPDEEIETYTQRQKALNKAGIGIALFASILDKVKMATADDNGKQLLQRLSEYGNLDHTIKDRQLEVNALTEQVQGLEEQAKLKGHLEAQVTALKAERATLQAETVDLYAQKSERDKLQKEVSALTNEKSAIGPAIEGLKSKRTKLAADIQGKEQKAKELETHLKSLESQHGALQVEVSKQEAQVHQQRRRWDIFTALMAFLQETSVDTMEKLGNTLPELLEEVKHGNYSVENAVKIMLTYFGVNGLHHRRCTSCQVYFSVDGQPPTGGYHCPVGGSPHGTIEDKNPLEVLRSAFSLGKPIPVQGSFKIGGQVPKELPASDKGKGVA